MPWKLEEIHYLVIGCILLIKILHDSIITNGLSNCDHRKGGSPKVLATVEYMREGVTNKSTSHLLIHDSWKHVWWHCLSKSKREAYPLVGLSFVASIIENLPQRALKVTPRYTYDSTTSTHLVLTWANVWKIRTLVFHVRLAILCDPWTFYSIISLWL